MTFTSKLAEQLHEVVSEMVQDYFEQIEDGDLEIEGEPFKELLLKNMEEAKWTKKEVDEDGELSDEDFEEKDEIMRATISEILLSYTRTTLYDRASFTESVPAWTIRAEGKMVRMEPELPKEEYFAHLTNKEETRKEYQEEAKEITNSFFKLLFIPLAHVYTYLALKEANTLDEETLKSKRKALKEQYGITHKLIKFVEKYEKAYGSRKINEEYSFQETLKNEVLREGYLNAVITDLLNKLPATAFFCIEDYMLAVNDW